MTGLEDMTTAQLLERHNVKCDPDRRLSSWKGKRSDLIERVRALGETAPIEVESKATEGTEAKPKQTIGASVRQLLLDPALSYTDIVTLIKAAHPKAATTARSIASVACVLRKNGTDVPTRRGAK